MIAICSSIFVQIVEVVAIPHHLAFILVSDATPKAKTAEPFNLLV
jgi:hypothetical protein